MTTSSTNQDSCSGVLPGEIGGVGDDRQADDVDALDQRLVDVLRKLAANARDGVLDVVQRPVGVGLKAEMRSS